MNSLLISFATFLFVSWQQNLNILSVTENNEHTAVYEYIESSNHSQMDYVEAGSALNLDLGVTENNSALSAPCLLPVGTVFKKNITEYINNNLAGLSSIKFIANSTIENLKKGKRIGNSNAYIHTNGTTLEIHTAASIFSFNANCNTMFSELIGITTIDFNNCITTSKVTNMSGMFRKSKVTSLDLRTFDTSNVENMLNMFNLCADLKSVDLSSFETSKVTNMLNMFSGCTNLSSLDLTKFNTSKVENMSNMFGNCNNLISLDLSNFNTSKVTDMSKMFINCYKLKSLDIRKFTFKKVEKDLNIFNNLGQKLGNKKAEIIVTSKPKITIPATAKAMYVGTDGKEIK